MRVLFRDVATQARSYRDKWTNNSTGDRSVGRSAVRSTGGTKLSVFGKSQNTTLISSIGPPVPPKTSGEHSFLDTSSAEPSPSLAFAEAGNVWGDIKKTDPFDLRRSVGFGTRLLLPAVGLVGFDFGYGFDRLVEDKQEPKWLFHFQFGRGF